MMVGIGNSLDSVLVLMLLVLLVSNIVAHMVLILIQIDLFTKIKLAIGFVKQDSQRHQYLNLLIVQDLDEYLDQRFLLC
jgi:hypothetical protein